MRERENSLFLALTKSDGPSGSYGNFRDPDFCILEFYHLYTWLQRYWKQGKGERGKDTMAFKCLGSKR
jgi:hypothetical protein